VDEVTAVEVNALTLLFGCQEKAFHPVKICAMLPLKVLFYWEESVA